MLLVAFSVAGCDSESQPTETADWEKAQEELVRRFLRAFANKDVDGVMVCFRNSPDVTLVLENGFVVVAGTISALACKG